MRTTHYFLISLTAGILSLAETITNSASAMTLFRTSPQHHTWNSNFNGTVVIDGNLWTQSYGDMKLQIEVNGNSQYMTYSADSVSKSGYRFNTDVSIGDTINFLLAPTNVNNPVSYNHSAEITVPSGLVFTEFTEPVPINSVYPSIITQNFSATILSTIPSNVRSEPNTTLAPVRQVAPNTTLNFDAWTRGEFVNQADLGRTSDLWYRIAGTKNEWLSGALFPDVPLSLTLTARIDHVGFFWGGDQNIYESYGAYPSGYYYQPLLQNNPTRLITADDGVQNQHDLSSFIHRSKKAQTSPVTQYRHFDIKEEHAKDMQSKIAARLTEKYFEMNQNPNCYSLSNNTFLSYSYQSCIVSPYQQKGVTGEGFSGVGLTEWASEGVVDSEGFVPDDLELLTINSVVTLSSNNTVQQFQAQSAPQVSFLTPDLQRDAIINNYANGDWLKGWVESANFTLLDPDNNVLARYTKGQNGDKVEKFSPDVTVFEGDYTGRSALGLPIFAQDAASDEQCEADPPQPVEKYFQFMVRNRQSGQYTLNISGLNKNAKAVFGTSKNATLIYPGECGTIPIPKDVPEPSSILGLLAMTVLGWGWQRQKRYSESSQ